MNNEWETIHKMAFFNDYSGLLEELNSGIDVNLRMNDFPSKENKHIRYWNNMTPLYLASYKGNNKCVKLLMERGADPNIKATNLYYKNNITPNNVALTFLNFRTYYLLKKKYKKTGLLKMPE